LVEFNPRPGAAGFQLSNPSALDLAAVVASLQIFNETSISDLRSRSLRLTRFLELLLDDINDKDHDFTIITPRNPAARGAQISIRLKAGFLDPVLEHLDEHGVVIDERKPDVIRVAPAPLYNTFADVFDFCEILRSALVSARGQVV
jgi:kynureninase